jgi:hypothetical protein
MVATRFGSMNIDQNSSIVFILNTTNLADKMILMLLLIIMFLLLIDMKT